MHVIALNLKGLIAFLKLNHIDVDVASVSSPQIKMTFPHEPHRHLFTRFIAVPVNICAKITTD